MILLGALMGRLSLIDRIVSNDLPTPAEAQGSDAFVQHASLVSGLVYVAATIAFLMWLHRVVAVNHALGCKLLQFSPRWAVGWWFIPFASLVRPEQVVEESWRATDLTVRESTPDSRAGLRAPILVRVWWGSFVLFYVTAVVFAVSGSTTTISAIRDATNQAVFSRIVGIVSAGLAIAVVLLLTARQERRANMAQQPAELPTPGRFAPVSPPQLS
ncbi:MAG: DUF4328 domain-containing protein [Candidatus Dormibacteraeota bacterium]|nr:DUF4328 domain-containing protein [Candidatus Dormibacteraeota bacterium]